MKKFLFLLIVLIAFGAMSAASLTEGFESTTCPAANCPVLGFKTKSTETITIGNGNTDQYLPIKPNFKFSYTQSIYLKQDINVANQRIEKIAYYWNGAAAGVNSKDWKVYIGHTTKDRFTIDTDWVPYNELTEVFSGVVTLPAYPGWVEIELTTPFTYDNVRNLVIAVDENTAAYDSGNCWFHGTSYTGNPRSILFYSDSINPNPVSPPVSGNTLTRKQAYPNIKLEFGNLPGAPEISLAPEALDFGAVCLDTTSPYKDIVIGNDGGGTINISDIQLTGTDAARFILDMNSNPLPWSLAADETKTLKVAFHPLVAGVHSAALVITSDLRGTHQVTLSGTGYDPVISAFPYATDFEGAVFPPLGWTVVNSDGSGTTWESSGADNHTTGGSNSAYHDQASGEQDGWLITAPIALPASGKYQMSFWDYTSSPGDMEYHGVLINNTNAVPDAGWDELWSAGSASQTWTNTKVDLAAYAGQTVFLAFRYTGNNAAAWHVDDIRIETYYDVNDNDNVYTVDAPTSTTVSITGGNANVNTSIDETSLPAWNNSGFTLAASFKLELFGAGPWMLTINTAAPWAAYYYNGEWIALDASSGTVTFTINPARGDEDIDVIMGDKNPTLPVELSSFTATIHAQNSVQLIWITKSETGVMGFYIYRSQDNDLRRAEKISDLIFATNTSQTQCYEYLDTELDQDGVYYYWLEIVDFDGSHQYHGPVFVEYFATQPGIPEIPLVTQIKSVYPNPFNPMTRISYELARDADVRIFIYNTRGQMVKCFPLGHKTSGTHYIEWDGKSDRSEACATGIYYIKMQTGAKVYTTKAVLIK